MKNHLFKSFIVSIVTITIFLTGCGSDNTSGTDTNTTDPITKVVKITSDNNVSIFENNSTNVLTITTDSNDTFGYTLSGIDKGIFDIDANGLLKFLQTPDFEQKQNYSVTVEVRDGDKIVASQIITVIIKDDLTDNTDAAAPEFINLPTIQEVQENRLEIMTILANDDISSVRYAILDGNDSALFFIDETSGELKFSHFVPDFESPSDADKNNDYELTLLITDEASNENREDITIRVTDDTSDDASSASAVVLKTGVSDGPTDAGGYGDVRSTDTGLNWEDDAHVNTKVTWDEAVNYCADKSMRVPTRKELFTLVNYGKFGSQMIDDSFTHKSSGLYWTSTNLLRGEYEIPTKAWAIDFRFGGDDYYDKNISKFDSYDMNVRCVSGAATFSSGDDFENQGDTIIDTKTNLVWEHNETATTQELNWQDAVNRCKAKGSDWRLPNINELHTIMPENEMNSLLVGILGDNQNSIKYMWSSTEVPGNANQALFMGNREVPSSYDGIHFGDTQNNEQALKDLNDSIRSMCVRGGNL